LDMKSAEFAHCPLCKSGIYEEKKEHVEEFDIDSMEQLIQKRDGAKTESDVMLQLFQEQLIVEKACNEKWDPQMNSVRVKQNENVLLETLQHWSTLKKIEEFRPKILLNVRTAMDKDMSNIVKIILTNCGYTGNNIDKEKEQELVELVNYGCSVESYDCVECIFKIQKNLNIENRPVCLSNAIKSKNTDLTELVFTYLKNLDRAFVCDECFTQCIKSDDVTSAQAILLSRWHKPRDEDYTLAERMDNAVYVFLQERKNATILLNTAADSSAALKWDDAEWGDDGNEEEAEQGWDDEDNE